MTHQIARLHAQGVAGVDAPAFVERSRSAVGSPAAEAGVAGVDAPAFVERDVSQYQLVRVDWC